MERRKEGGEKMSKEKKVRHKRMGNSYRTKGRGESIRAKEKSRK